MTLKCRGMTQEIPPPIEQQRLRASHVYLDASVYRALQFDWGGRWLRALADLAHRGLIRVVVTEITLREVKSLMREMWSDANKSMQRFAVVLGQLGFGDAVSAMADEEACTGPQGTLAIVVGGGNVAASDEDEEVAAAFADSAGELAAGLGGRADGEQPVEPAVEVGTVLGQGGVLQLRAPLADGGGAA